MMSPKLCRSVRIAAALSASALASCSTTIVEPYYRPASAQIEQAYLRPGVDFGKYTRLLPTPLEIYYPESVPQPSDADLSRLRMYFRDAFIEALGDDYSVTYDAAPDALRVRAKLEDSLTNQVLGRAGESTSSEAGNNADDASWNEVQAAAERWADLFRNWLDANLAQARR